jgi:SpoVK/Ycf46/Vps4 family AAA+-type ATPase
MHQFYPVSLQSLCAEAALLALRRRYPQVYNSKDKLLLDLSQINVKRRDFEQAVQRLVPASQRSALASGKPLSSVITPLLGSLHEQLINSIQRLFPEGIATLKLKGAFFFSFDTISKFFKNSFLTYL